MTCALELPSRKEAFQVMVLLARQMGRNRKAFTIKYGRSLDAWGEVREYWMVEKNGNLISSEEDPR